jgi:hypothetical protein
MDDSVSFRVPTLKQLAELVWQLSAELRREAHRNDRSTGCRTRFAPYGESDPNGTMISQACRDLGCLDLVHELLLIVGHRLEARSAQPDVERPADPLRYANTTVQRAVADLRRSRRVAQGLPAKPSRSDGTAAHVESELRARSPHGGQVEWFVQLFRLVRSYPCRPGAAGRRWPLDAWTAEKTKTDRVARAVGSSTARAELAADVRFVLEVTDAVAGASWRYRNITEPLIRGGDTAQPLGEMIDDHPLTAPLEKAAMVRLFEQCYRRLRSRGVSQMDAFRDAAQRIYGELPRAQVHYIINLARELDTPGRREPAHAGAQRLNKNGLGPTYS